MSMPRPVASSGAGRSADVEQHGLDPARHWIVWDGECGFCRRAVEWALAHDVHGLFVAVPYQRLPDPPLTPELRTACRAAVHVRTSDGRWLRGGRACLFILERIGWPHVARLARLPPLVWVVEAGYRLVAGNRGFFSRFAPARYARDGRRTRE